MDAVQPEAATAIWNDLIKDVVQREGIDLSSIGYDGTNFYTFLDTLNTRCSLAVRGKNKQGRDNLRQVSYALFCAADGQLPLFYEVYEGNRNDARQFSLVLERFHQFFRELAGGATVVPETTLIFDKGNNAADNFRLWDSLKLKFVGSVKQNEHPELAQVPHSDPRFVVCANPGLKGAKAFRVTKTVAGSERVLVVTYTPNLATTQWMTLQNDVAKASQRLSELQGRLAGRAAGLIKGGKHIAPDRRLEQRGLNRRIGAHPLTVKPPRVGPQAAIVELSRRFRSRAMGYVSVAALLANHQPGQQMRWPWGGLTRVPLVVCQALLNGREQLGLDDRRHCDGNLLLGVRCLQGGVMPGILGHATAGAKPGLSRDDPFLAEPGFPHVGRIT